MESPRRESRPQSGSSWKNYCQSESAALILEHKRTERDSISRNSEAYSSNERLKQKKKIIKNGFLKKYATEITIEYLQACNVPCQIMYKKMCKHRNTNFREQMTLGRKVADSVHKLLLSGRILSSCQRNCLSIKSHWRKQEKGKEPKCHHQRERELGEREGERRKRGGERKRKMGRERERVG